jgi:hypothetical protein
MMIGLIERNPNKGQDSGYQHQLQEHGNTTLVTQGI